jgi:tetratricopeptide (TPR) repeat protein
VVPFVIPRATLSVLLVTIVAMPLHGQTNATPQAVQQGWQAIQAGDAERAASVFQQALASRPNDDLLHFGAGVAAHMLGREDDAERSLKRALVLNARLTDASKLLGDIEYSLGNLDEAIAAYQRVVAERPADAVIRQRLEAWQKELVLHSGLTRRNDGRFSIIFEGSTDSALADRALSLLDAAYWRIGGAIGAYPSSSIMVTLYTEQQFRDLTGAPDWSDGLFDGRIRVPVKGAHQNLPEFDRVIVHELTHAMIATLAPRRVPPWLHEGLASYFEAQDASSRITRALRVLKITGPVPSDVLFEGFTRLNDRQAAAAYSESLLLANVLMQRAGTRMGIVLQNLDRGQTLEQSLALLGISLADLESDVITTVK